MRKTFAFAVLFIFAALAAFADTGPPVNLPDNPAEFVYLQGNTDSVLAVSSSAILYCAISRNEMVSDGTNMSLLVPKPDVAVGHMRNGGTAYKPYIIRLSAPSVRTLAYHRNNSASRPLRV